MVGKSYWVIREIATGRLFPSQRGNQSYIEFSDELPPRLYTRRQDALASIRHWAMGHSYIPWNRRNDEYGDCFDYVTKPVDNRSVYNVELVEITLEMKI